MAFRNRTLPFDMVMECKREGVGVTKSMYGETYNRKVDVSKRTADLYACAVDHFTDKYGPPSSIVGGRIRDTARRVAGGISAYNDAKRRRLARKGR